MSDAELPDSHDDLPRIVESMLFAAHESLSAQRIARALGRIKAQRVEQAIAGLAQRYEEQGSPLMLVEIAGGWRLVTRPEYAPFLARLFSRAEKERLSPAALETLAIVAYRQPATRAEIEAVRGVVVGPVLKLLQERRLVKVVGRAEVVGRPMQYGTTRRFLDHFGLADLDELPKVFPGRAPPAEKPAPAPEAGSDGEAEGEAEVDGGNAAGAPPDGVSAAVREAPASEAEPPAEPTRLEPAGSDPSANGAQAAARC